MTEHALVIIIIIIITTVILGAGCLFNLLRNEQFAPHGYIYFQFRRRKPIFSVFPRVQ